MVRRSSLLDKFTRGATRAVIKTLLERSLNEERAGKPRGRKKAG